MLEGERRMYVHPRCKNTIKGFRSVTFKEGAEDFVVDKDPGLEHWIDGCGYLDPECNESGEALGWACQEQEGPGLVIKTRRVSFADRASA